MIRKIFIFLILALIFTSSCKVKENKNTELPMNDFNYEQAWKKVEELEKKGLSKTMFKKVIEIYEKAREEKNGEQLIKSLAFQGKYYVTVEEDGLIKTIERFEENLASGKDEEKAILQSMLGQLYDTYLMQYLWKIGNRIPSAEETDADIRKWTPEQFVDKSTSLYLASLSYPGLKNIEASDYLELFPERDKMLSHRNTLLDILGHRAIDYFSSEKSFLTQSPDRFILNDPDLFNDTGSFMAMDFSAAAESRELIVLKLFQRLLKDKLESNNKEAILDLEISRLQFVRKHFISTDTDDVFENALITFQKDYKGLEGVAELNFLQAQLYFKKGNEKSYDEYGESGFFVRAHQICDRTIRDFPGTYGADMCKSLLSNIENKQLTVRTEMVNLPGEHLISRVEYKNVSEIFMKVVRITEADYSEISKLNKDEVSRFLKGLTVVQAMEQKLPGAGDFKQHAVEIALDPLSLGAYALVISDHSSFNPENGLLQLSPFFVSKLSYWHTNIEDKNLIYVADRSNGKALEGVKVRVFQWEYERRSPYKKLLHTLVTDENGAVQFNNSGSSGYNYTIELESAKESLYFENSLYAGTNYRDRQAREKVLFYTDRAIYRPGQTVHFKGILIREHHDRAPEIIPFREDIEIFLKDVNQQEVGKLTLHTNEFGSFSGSFNIPESGLTGRYTMGTDISRNRQSIRVEAYKRPKFEVALEEYESAYKLGDEIKIEGKAQSYGGVNISDARVIYRVSRKTYFPFWSYSWRPIPFNTRQVEIANGTTKTDDKGHFEVPVELLADDQVPGQYRPYFQYEIYAEVTDPTGETHHDKLFLQAGWDELDVRLKVDKEIHKDSLVSLEVISNNWNGKPQELQGSLEVLKLDAPNTLFRKRFWTMPDQWIYEREAFKELLPSYSFRSEEDPQQWKTSEKVSEFKINTADNRNFDLDLPAGHYKLSFEYIDGKGIRKQVEQFISVFSDSELPAQKAFNIRVKGGEPGQKAMLSLQSKMGKTPILVEIFEQRKRTVASWKDPGILDNIFIELEEKHRGNFFARTTWVYDNRFYTFNHTFEVPWSNKELEFEYLSFREKIKPGSPEKWIIKISGPEKEKVLSEMLANMYDSSLDDLQSHHWQSNLFRRNYLSSQIHYFGFGQARPRTFVERNWNEYYYSNKQKKYRTLNWFGLEHIPGYQIFKEGVGIVESAPPRTRERMMTDKAATGATESGQEADAVNVRESEETTNEQLEGGYDDTENAVTDSEVIPQKIRSNLNETVFFYPHLKTDESGNVILEFDMNEALTRWKFMGLAHTQDLKIGFTTREIITQKELMIRPNPPRFARTSDQLTFGASVSNLTESQLTGTANIQLFDAISMEDITDKLLSDNAEKEVLIESGGNIGISWGINISPESPELILYKVFTKSDNYSDGEEGIIPVLSNRVLVTETIPMWVSGKSGKQYKFKAFDKWKDKGLESHRFSLETTSNPIWYAIQAIPYVAEYREKNSIELVNALFVNQLSSKILEDNPPIEQVFNKWKTDTGNKDGSLQSNLRKNEELKNILLKETPWLLEAVDEETQKKNIALLFELNNIANQKTRIISLLTDLQRYDGGFSWFPKGKSSEYLTLYVMGTLGKLEQFGIDLRKDYRIINMLNRAIQFADARILERYNKLMEKANNGQINPDDDHLGSTVVLYLYVRSMFADYAIPANTREANVFYINQAEKYFLNRSNYMQAMIALSLHNNGNSSTALQILHSLNDRSIYNEELGRYWKYKSGYSWTEFPLEIQSLMVEAFSTQETFEKEVQQMQLWLLKHKQTNRWKTPRASVAAIHALLINNSSMLVQDDHVKVKLAGMKIDTEESAEAGTGYFKKEWSGEEISESFKDIEIQNPNDHIAWGAAYWQYFQDIDKVKAFEDTPLKIQKKLYKKILDKKGERLEEITANEKIDPGSQVIVRFVIVVDRPMDYIRLDDRRAASFEPMTQLSGYKWTGGLFYYEAPGDSGTNFYIDHLPRGTFVIEYPLRAVHSGDFTSGSAVIQSMYAPEFSSHSGGSRLVVE